MDNQTDDPTKLNNQLVQLLEGLNNRKSRIDEQVKFLSHLPKILPFEPLPPEHSLVSSETWETWWSEHDQIEKEAGIFREDEFALMKQVAMSKTTNMSREDTDIVGLTLCTLEAFSKLEHLLRSRRKQIQILELRIKWDHQTKKVWQDLQDLESHLPKILSKIRWNLPCQDMDHQIHSTISSHHFNSSSLTPPSSTLSSSLTSPSTTKRADILSRSLPSQGSVCHNLPTSHSSKLMSRKSDPNDLDTNSSPFHATIDSSSSFIPRSLSHFIQSSPISSDAKRFSPMHSLPSLNDTYSSAITVSSSYSSPQSRAMRIQSLTLQLTSIISKIHTLNRSVALTSTTIDQLIDSSLHVPEVFLDLQDKVEAAVRSLQPVQAANFCNALMEQYKEADDLWFDLFNLGLEVESNKREIDHLIATAQVDQVCLANFQRQYDRFLTTYETHHLRTQLRNLPAHSNYPEQSKFNQNVIKDLLSSSEHIRRKLNQYNDSIQRYRSASEALRQSEALRSSMRECERNLTELIRTINNLNEQHPQRPWLMKSPDCLTPHDKEKEYETEWDKIMVELEKSLVTGVHLIETARVHLINLNPSELDSNLKSELQEARKVLENLVQQAQQFSSSKEQSFERLSRIRHTWGKIIDVQTEMQRFGDQLLLNAHREKWKARKVSSSTPDLPAEELDSAASSRPSLWQSYKEVEKYISESIQPLFDTTLAELEDEQFCDLRQYFSRTFEEVLNIRAPQIARLEQIIQQICLQTSQVRKVENEYDDRVIEGGRWMKKLQGLIGVELEHTYEEFDHSTNLSALEARQVEKSSSEKALALLPDYLHGIDSLCNSLSSRIPLISKKNVADRLVTRSGRVILDCGVHDRSVHTHLNVLSINLMSLRDQIFSESIFLKWINSPQVAEFEQAVNNVRHEIQTANNDLEKLEAHIHRIQSLFESDADQLFLTDDQLEQTVDQPLRSLQSSLEQIENRLSESTSVHLGAFITSCPSSSSSQAFKPDQFILPKQMSHHQLQSLYNQTYRRLQDTHTLCMNFKNETYSRRKNELAWRKDWARTIVELTEDFEKLQNEIVILDSEIVNLDEESIKWESNSFGALERIQLEELNDRTPICFNELKLFESRLSQSLARLEAFHNKIHLFHKRTLAVKEDIEDKVPVFIHLVSDLITLPDQLSCQWQKSRDVGRHVSDSINRFKNRFESFTKEFEKRLSWKSQCHQVMDAQLEAVMQSFISFDEATDQLSNICCSLHQGQNLDGTQETFFSLLSCLRSFNEHKTVSFAPIKSNIQVVQEKLLIIEDEIIALSTIDVPHGYLIEAQTKLNSQIDELKRRTTNLESLEKDILAFISLVHTQHEARLTEELEDEIISKHYDIENAQLTDWSKHYLGQFIDLVQTESIQIEKLLSLDELSPLQTPIVRRPQRSPTSVESIELLANINSDVKDRLTELEGLVKSTSDTSQRLNILNLSRAQLARQIDFFRQTLPSRCNNYLEKLLRDPHSEFNKNEPNRFEAASSKLQEIESKIAALVCLSEDCLTRANENLLLIQDETHVMNTCSRLCSRLNECNIDEWINDQDNSPHSPLPNDAQLEQILETLKVTSSGIEKLCSVGIMMDQPCLKDTLDLLKDRNQKTEILRRLVNFQSATSKCDQSFSALLDALDIRQIETKEIDIGELVQSASAALEILIKVSKKIDRDRRVEYHVNRSKQIWEELETMIKDRAHDPKTQNWNDKPHSMSALPLPVRMNHYHGHVSSTPPSMNLITARQKHSSDQVPERTERSGGIPIGLMESPSYRASRRNGKRTPDPSSPQTSSRFLRSETLNSKLIPPRPVSRETQRSKEFDSISSSSSKGINERPGLRSVLGNTPSRSSKNKSLAITPNSSFGATLYKPQSNRNIDQLVGKVVNSLARNKLRVHVAPAEGWEDNSGMYWIGEKVYFCRILRSKTVMVRIGGGWCELSAFILEHLRLTTSSNASHLELRTVGGSERLTQVDQLEHSLIELSSSSKLSLPTNSAVTSCHSTPSNKCNLTDSSTSSTPESSITTVLVTTPQDIRIINHPNHSSSSSNKHSNQQHTPTFQSGNSLLSTPIETVQMLFRKAENRSYLSNNQSPCQH